MSYSFNVRAPSKAEAKLAVSAKLDEIVAQQLGHAADRAAAEATAHAFIDMLKDGVDQDVRVDMHGSVSGSWGTGVLTELTNASVNVSAYFWPREKTN